MKGWAAGLLIGLAAVTGGPDRWARAEQPEPGTVPVLVLATTFDEPGASITRTPEWVGWPSSRTLRVTLVNPGAEPVAGLRVDAGSSHLVVDELAPGEQRTVSLAVDLPALRYGRHVVDVDITAAGHAAVGFTAATSNWPWLAIATLAFGTALGVLELRRRGRRADAPRRRLADTVAATAWTALALAVGITAVTLTTARRADAGTAAAQQRLARQIDAQENGVPAGGSARSTSTEGRDHTPDRSGVAERFVAPPAVAAPGLGQPLGELRIPRLGDEYGFVAVEGVRDADLADGPGHYPGTAMPGEIGNFVLTGHRTSHLAPFARLDDLERGDDVLIDAAGGTFVYRVTGTRVVPPTALDVLLPVPGQPGRAPEEALLTLITCHPEHSTRERLVVTAEFAGFRPSR